MPVTDVYDVGWLAALRYARRILAAPELAGHRTEALWRIRQEWRYTIAAARAGNWRHVRNTFNGWMAEPRDHTNLIRCGTGWTRGRALRSLRRHGYAPYGRS
jgi:hypothetical protein